MPRFTHIFLVLSVLLQSVSETIVFPSIWLFLSGHFRQDQRFLGWAIAAYSAGRGLSLPLLFRFFMAHSTPRWSLYLALTLQLIGSLSYAWVDRLPYPEWCLLASRFVLGLSTANSDVVADWLARSGAKGHLGAWQGVGLLVGPLLGLALSPLDWRPALHWIIDAETSPGYLIAMFSVLNFIFLAVLWRDFPSFPPTSLSQHSTLQNSEPIHFFPLLVSSFLFGVMGTVFATFESITPLVTDHEVQSLYCF